MEKTIIYIVRHGESLGNKMRQFLGHTDLDLSELGYKQAEVTARELSSVKLDAIYSSDLLRAFNTAKPHAAIRGLNVITNRGLREMFVGEWEGLYVEDIISRYGEDMFLKDWHGKFGTFKFPSGEGTIEAGRRFYNTVVDIASANPGKTILIAAHAAVIRAFWSIISEVAPEEIVEKIPFATNASYSVCEFSEGKLRPIRYSVDEHLAEVGITRVIAEAK